ncbi:hypothetical protein PAXRUDRAFT_129181 [Paxillus rubicundulus Ve08.2h10]|uniref:Uncharacterized protein n=1 Tax=Paxillus rubicundulus Ve08.2h10 TaxID=930991 RepID=A0A0D0EAU2_9AGAM|nr:hypothetical protein PAXRUDRAFT_129181 [Paxillus rubicundulus Ve08.2h10]
MQRIPRRCGQTIISSILRTASISTSFERKGKGKVMYSHQKHTHTETRFIKTGRPEYYLLSPSTVLQDIKLIFAWTHQRIASMLQDYDGMLSFTTNAWTSPNHCAFLAFSVHLQYKGIPLSMPLDIAAVSISHT